MPILFGLISLVLFILGAAFGSFLNVVVYRSLKNESWTKGRSKCDSCHKQLKWYDNIPLLSYVFLRGKCRFCHKKIGLTHPVVEFLIASLFVWWYWGGTLFFNLTQHPFSVFQPLFWLSVGLILMAILVADYLYLIIPDKFVAILLFLTVVYRLALTVSGIMQLDDLVMAIAGTVLATGFIGSLWWITGGKGMGMGDVKLMVPLALLLGWPKVIVGIFASFIVGALVGVVLLASKKKKMGQVIPFGPFMIIGTFISLIWGEQLLRWYMAFL